MIDGWVGMAGWALSGAAGATELASSRAAAAATAHGGMVYRQARSVALCASDTVYKPLLTPQSSRQALGGTRWAAVAHRLAGAACKPLLCTTITRYAEKTTANTACTLAAKCAPRMQGAGRAIHDALPLSAG